MLASHRRYPLRGLIIPATVLTITACGATESTDSSPTLPPSSDTIESQTPSTNRPAGDDSGQPGTTLLPRPFVIEEPLTSIAPVELIERCPKSAVGLAANDPVDQTGMLAEQARLESMLDQVVAYGVAHPDDFVSSGMIWHGPGDASVFASFVADHEHHRLTLGDLVEHSDELIVCQAGASADEMIAIEATLLEELRGRFLGIGRGSDGLFVQLMAGEEALAAELDARYGAAITLMVGDLTFPIEGAVATCREPPLETSVDGLDIVISPPGEPVSTSGHRAVDFTVTLTNTGGTPIDFGSGTSQGVLLDDDGKVVSALADMTAAGIAVVLAPGQSSDLPVLVSTASCDPALGSEIPAGTYTLVATVFHSSDGDNLTLSSSPLRITLVN